MNKEEKVYSIFQKIAKNYDSANDRMSFGMQRDWKKHLTDAVEHNVPTGSALDVCCGTGDIAIALSKNLRTTGLDFSPAMLDIAKQRSSEVTWISGSAMKLPFADNSFDACTISFGLRNTADFKTVLLEMKRVVRPGGFIFVLDSFELKKGFVFPFYKFYFKNIVPLICGKQKYTEEYKWLNQSTESFLSPEALGSLMESIDLDLKQIKEYLFGACCLLFAQKKKS